MSDIIRLLPDSVANQIAAGEVIQRPASAAKELLENAIDAGATSIQLLVKDAGKSLIQVIDDGSGMSETDLRMAFERHATSKINQAEDLFVIRTMGFRGEALASIAAVAQVEVKTRLHDQPSGSQLLIEGSKVQNQDPCATPPGTSIAARNLFFNIPARRNFLKSNASEMRHILDEFQRVAIARPNLAFTLFHDGVEVFRLPATHLRQRLVSLFGSGTNEKLVPVEETTTILKLDGFVMKPEFARKTRGEQYLYVNRRFIRSAYLNHAISDAFEDLVQPGTFPSYYLFIDIDPARIDINIHPTKTEIKFDDEKSVYAILRAAVKRALGRFSITPSLDFDQETAFNIPVAMYQVPPKPPGITVTPGYNPFHTETARPPRTDGWEKIYEAARTRDGSPDLQPGALLQTTPETPLTILGQWLSSYIVAIKEEQLVVIDQQAAHARILYDKFKTALEKAPVVSQQELFPKTFSFSHADCLILSEIEDDIRKMGFDLRPFGTNTYVLNAVPSGVEPGTEKEILDAILETFKNTSLPKSDRRENLLRSISRNLAVKPGTALDRREMEHIAGALFLTSMPSSDPSGNATLVTFGRDDIFRKIKR